MKMILIILFSIVAFFFAISTSQAMAVEEVPDVGPDYWSYDAIMYFKDKNVVAGYPDGLYRPDQKVTRAEFATIVTKALGLRDLSEITYTTYKAIDENH